MPVPILALVTAATQLMPLATQLLDILSTAQGQPTKSNDTLDLITKLMPIAGAMVTRVEEIRVATEKDHPELWAKVSGGWSGTVGKWKTIQAQN